MQASVLICAYVCVFVCCCCCVSVYLVVVCHNHRAVLSLPPTLSKRERALWHGEADRLGLKSDSTVRGREGGRDR